MTQWLRELAILLEDLSLVPITHTRQLTKKKGNSERKYCLCINFCVLKRAIMHIHYLCGNK